MGVKEHRFPNQVGADKAWGRLEPELGNLSKQYGLDLEKVGTTSVTLKRTGADVLATITENEVVVRVDLSWFVPKTIEQKIEAELNSRIPPLLKA